MKPTDHATPVELFGVEALTSLRHLRRAYAALIREFTPEQHPDAFAHIRRLYERARRRLVASPARLPAGTRPAGSLSTGTPSSGIPGRTGPQASERRIRLLSTLAQDPRPPAQRRWMALLAAGSALSAREALQERWAKCPPNLRQILLVDLLQLRPELGSRALWEPVFETGSVPGTLLCVRLRGLTGARMREAAVELLADGWEELRTSPPSVQREILRLLADSDLLWWLPDARLDEVERLLATVEPGRGHGLVERLLRRVGRVRDLRAALDDPAVPDDLPPVLWAADRADAVQASLLLQDVRAAFERAGEQALQTTLARRHPAVLRMVDELLDRASLRYAWARHWMRHDAPPPPFEGTAAVATDVLDGLDRALASQRLPPLEVPVGAGLRRALPSVAGVGVVVLVGAATAGAVDESNFLAGFVEVLGISVAVALPVVGLLIAKALRVERRSRVAAHDPIVRWRAELRQAAQADMAATGLWTHELAARLEPARSEVVAAFVEELLADRTADVRAVSDAHCGQVAWRPTDGEGTA